MNNSRKEKIIKWVAIIVFCPLIIIGMVSKLIFLALKSGWDITN